MALRIPRSPSHFVEPSFGPCPPARPPVLSTLPSTLDPSQQTLELATLMCGTCAAAVRRVLSGVKSVPVP